MPWSRGLKSLSPCLRPAGWDNEKKVAILHENLTAVKPEDPYEDFIVKPPVRKVLRFPGCSFCIGKDASQGTDLTHCSVWGI